MFLILIIANVIHAIFYSPSFMMSFVIIPFHTSSPQDSGSRKTPKKETKKPNNQTTRSFFQLLEENVLSSLVRNSRYLIWETEISNPSLMLTPLVCTYPATTHKLQLADGLKTLCSSIHNAEILEKTSHRYQQWSHFVNWLLY